MAKEAAEGVAGAVETVKGWPQRVRNYVEALRMEMRRVTWPSKKQVRATTVVVIVTVFVFAVYFAIVDWILNFSMGRIFLYFTR
jgi:preprotein translocase subunit SecE